MKEYECEKCGKIGTGDLVKIPPEWIQCPQKDGTQKLLCDDCFEWKNPANPSGYPVEVK